MNEAERFCRNFLYTLPDGRREGRAILAALRRGLGKPPGAVPEVLKWVYPELEVKCRPEERVSREDPFLIVASLYAHHPVHRGAPGNLGATLAQVRAGEKGTPSLDKRFEALLQCHRTGLPVLLRHTVSLIRSADKAIDYARLCEDIARWDDPDPENHPQRSWARAYWHPGSDADEPSGAAGAVPARDSE
jgi:CRISPR system Cascade subunit CasB